MRGGGEGVRGGGDVGGHGVARDTSGYSHVQVHTLMPQSVHMQPPPVPTTHFHPLHILASSCVLICSPLTYGVSGIPCHSKVFFICSC